MIADALGDDIASIHHTGSTAIPAMIAKPIIDILCVMTSSTVFGRAAIRLQRIGYLARGENGIQGRRYFVRFDSRGVRCRHLHVFAPGSDHIERHLAFRDFLVAHPDRAAEYADVKTSVRETARSKQAYQEGKSAFIVRTLTDALLWYRQPDARIP